MPMTEHRFEDGLAYDRLMGRWTRLVGVPFLDWLSQRPGLRWTDIGCGSGAFAELIIDRCAPIDVQGIDPSEDQLRFARARSRMARFQVGDARALPFSENNFDVAVMALVIFFIPDPARSVTEMVRVVCPGGTVATYAWDVLHGGFPLEPILNELRALGETHTQLPSAHASRTDVLTDLWTSAGLQQVETREITVQRSFEDFEDFWTISLKGSNVGRTVAALPSDKFRRLRERVQAVLPPDAKGRIVCSARANAVKGRVPR
jgi:ubiquinone/menaquinone biosynthesis C-methylase UbiE